MVERRSWIWPLASLLMVSGCGDTPQDMFEKARHDYHSEAFLSARSKLIKGLKEEPENRELLALLIETELRLNDPEGAARNIGHYAKIVGDNAEVRRMRAQVALLRNAPDAVLAMLDKDTSVEAWRIRGEAHLLRKDAKAARTAFEQGMAAGGNIRLAASFGRFLLLNHDLPRAERLLAQLRKMDAQSYEALVMAGDLAVAKGHDAQSITFYQQAVDRFPNRLPPILALANQLDMAGRVEEAQKLIEQASQLAPDDADVEALRLQLMAEKGEWQKIRQMLQSREANLPSGSVLAMTYGEAMLQLNHPEQAGMVFRRALLVQPSNAYIRLMLGRAQLAAGDKEGAWRTLAPLAASPLANEEVMQVALEAGKAVKAREVTALQNRLRPENLKSQLEWVGQGAAAMQQEKWQEAVTVYEKLLQQYEDGEVLKRLATAKSALGDHKAAMAYADRAVAQARDNADFLYIAGLVRMQAHQDLRAAKSLLDQALELDPRNEAILQARNKVTAMSKSTRS